MTPVKYIRGRKERDDVRHEFALSPTVERRVLVDQKTASEQATYLYSSLSPNASVMCPLKACMTCRAAAFMSSSACASFGLLNACRCENLMSVHLAYLWKPVPSMRTSMYVCGNTTSDSSKSRTYAKRLPAMDVESSHSTCACALTAGLGPRWMCWRILTRPRRIARPPIPFDRRSLS